MTCTTRTAFSRMLTHAATVAAVLACAACWGDVPGPTPSTSTPTPTTATPTTATPTPTTSTPTPTPIPDDLDLTATFYGLSGVDLDMPPAQVEDLLGVQFIEEGVQVEHGSCLAVVEALGRVGVVVDAGRVQAYLVRVPGIPMVGFTDVPVEVGDPIDKVAKAYPQWYAGEYSSYTSRFNGPRITITPPGLSTVLRSRGLAALFEADPDGVIRQIRVGNASYVDHVDYCSTPD